MIPTQNAIRWFIDIDKVIIKFMWEYKRLRTPREFLTCKISTVTDK